MSARWRALLGACLLAAAGCNSALSHGLATAFQPTPSPEPWSYAPSGSPGGAQAELLARFAPAFEVEAGEAEWNRIGTPTLQRRAGIERARVDVTRPTLYAEARAERLGARAVWQLVYRIHFDQLAPSGAYLASLHRNAGLLVLVTLDQASGAPLLVSSVHTCGCWFATSACPALPDAFLPADWPLARQEVYGESLPVRLRAPEADERFVLALAARTHRVRDVRVARVAGAARALPLQALTELKRLPIAGAPGETGSFFHTAGYLRGYVKGAWAPLEGLTLGLLTLDPRLGMDRDFGDPAETGARFFLALAPWKREATRLDRFARALSALGFHPEVLAPAGASAPEAP